MTERKAFSVSGYSVLFLIFILKGLFVFFLLTKALLLAIPILVISVFMCFGFFMVFPNKAKVMILFGQYIGTVKENGLRWTNPFYAKKTISLRIRNFESTKLKVNDSDGNPIEIAAVVVWTVRNSAEALFEVDNYTSYVSIQSEAAIRNLATSYPYDSHDDNGIALRSSPVEIAEALRIEIQNRLEKAGMVVHEARISHLAYSPEIASAMLQRQQASAIIAAREKIVDGAVGMVHMALKRLSEQGIIELDEERKASMVSNLLVVLCGDKNTQPVVNAGSLY